MRVLKRSGTFLIINRYPKEGSPWWERAQIKDDREYIEKLKSAGFHRVAVYLDLSQRLDRRDCDEIDENYLMSAKNVTSEISREAKKEQIFREYLSKGAALNALLLPSSTGSGMPRREICLAQASSRSGLLLCFPVHSGIDSGGHRLFLAPPFPINLKSHFSSPFARSWSSLHRCRRHSTSPSRSSISRAEGLRGLSSPIFHNGTFRDVVTVMELWAGLNKR